MIVPKESRAARLISIAGSPPILALPLCFVCSFYELSQSKGAWPDLLLYLFLSITFSITLPTLFIVWQVYRKKVTDLHIALRQQRTVPYLVAVGCNLLGFIFTYRLVGPGLIAAVFVANVINGLLVTLINLRWKISAHLYGVGLPLAILLVLYGWWMLFFAFLLPVVGWARVKLKAHTLAQVVAGGLLGLFSTFLVLTYFSRSLHWF